MAARLHHRHRRGYGRSADRRTAIDAAAAIVPSTLLGEETVQSYADGLSAGQAEAFSFPARSSGVVGAAHVYVDSHNTATHLIVGLYGSVSGRPASLLTTGSISPVQPGAWATVPLASANVTSGTSYWLAILGTGGMLRYRDRLDGSCQGLTSSQLNLTALAKVWSTERGWWTCPLTAYVTAADALISEEPAPPLENPKSPSEPPPPPAPVNTALPTVSGSAVEGETLLATTGTWSNSPSSYAYQWEDCNASGEACASISGATASSYKLVAGDVGHTVRVVVTATNAGGSGNASSTATALVTAATPPAPVNTALPTVSGSAVEGETLKATTGTWSNSPTSYAYQWEDCNASGEACASISGATSSSYKLVAGDVGHTVRVVVTATNAGGSGKASSTATALVTAVTTPAPVDTALPSVSGSAVEGETLKASTGTWSNSPTSYAYQWEDCNASGEACASISGATSSSYKLAASDVGHTVRVVVTATNAGGSAKASSAATGSVVPPAPVNTALPSVSGSAVEGETLKASTGTWSNSPSSYAYQWEDCNASGEACASISGATSSSYKLAASDVGHTVRVVVTATNAGGSAKASSAATGSVVPPAPVNTALPSVSGSAVEGETLKASTGTWSNSPSSYAYQWEDCNALGEACLSISGATSSSYKLAASDVSSTVRVVVTATNAGGSAKASSAATAAVTAAESTGVLVGSNAVQANGDTSSAGSAEAFEYTAAASGTVRSVSLYVNTGNTASDVVVGLYNDASGNPGTLLASATINSPAAGAWNSVAISPTTVSSDATYWLAVLAPSGTLAIRDVASGGGPTKSSASSSLKELPSSWSSGASWANSPASLYASGTVVESPPPAPPTNTALPAVSGSAVEGETLSASAGTWTESPTSYAYQWEDCNAEGEACASVSGATSSSYKLTSGDVGHTVRVVVTASNAGGSAKASSAATATVIADPPPSAPTNTVAPSVSGTAEEGQTLSASSGTWTGDPTSYAYQWEDCSASGEACSSITDATSSSYTLDAGDLGHEVRVVVTAKNATGSASQASMPTSVVQDPTECSTTVSPATGVAAIDKDIEGAAGGSVVCMEGGSYAGTFEIKGGSRSSYVTVEAAPGAAVKTTGWVVEHVGYLRFVGIETTSTGWHANRKASDLQWIDDKLTGYQGIVVGYPELSENVLIEKDTFDKLLVNPAHDDPCKATEAGEGQGVTMEWASNVTIRDNRFKENVWHYIQNGEKNITVEDNLFEGPFPSEAEDGNCSEVTHLNVWQEYEGGENLTFDRNIIKGAQGVNEQVGVTPILFEHGYGGYPCYEPVSKLEELPYRNVVVENNLFIDSSKAYVVQMFSGKELVYRHNTVVGGEYGVWLGRRGEEGSGKPEYECLETEGFTGTHNITVGTESSGAPQNFLLDAFIKGAGEGWDYNVSGDDTASSNDPSYSEPYWSPKWQSTSWNPETEPNPPAGYYVPTAGSLKFAAGYEGTIGP